MNADDTPQNLGLVPMVIETSGRGERAYLLALVARAGNFFGW